MQLPRLLMGAIALAGLSLQACSHGISKAETDDPAELVRAACGADISAREVTGSVWMKAKSKEASGQFPATVQARAAPSSPLELRLEIRQLLGARAALIEIRGHDFKVETPKDGTVSRKAVSWGGIPLEWASQLFLDRFPCPSSEELGAFRWRWLESSELEGRPLHQLGELFQAGSARDRRGHARPGDEPSDRDLRRRRAQVGGDFIQRCQDALPARI